MTDCRLELKPGVRLAMLTPRMVLAAEIVRSQYGLAGIPVCTITTASDGKHATVPPSRHYVGDALDFRTNIWFGGWKSPVSERVHDLSELRAKIMDALGGPSSDFVVFLESVGTENEHLHVQFSPKEPY